MSLAYGRLRASDVRSSPGSFEISSPPSRASTRNASLARSAKTASSAVPYIVPSTTLNVDDVFPPRNATAAALRFAMSIRNASCPCLESIVYIRAFGMSRASSFCRWKGYSASLVMPTTRHSCGNDANTAR